MTEISAIKFHDSNDVYHLKDATAREKSEVHFEAVTLSASGWTGTSAPYQYDLGTGYADYPIVVGFDGAQGTGDQLEAVHEANISGGSGTVLYAFGEKPGLDIPIVIYTFKGGTA